VNVISCYQSGTFIVAGDLQITTKAHSDKTAVDVVAYYGQGVVYAVVMRLTNATGTTIAPGVAAYVPVVTYSCNFTYDQCAKHGEYISLSCVYIASVLPLCRMSIRMGS